MKTNKWYKQSVAVINRVILENKGIPADELRAKVSAAYPFGERENYPYREWLTAVRHLLGTSERSKAQTQATLKRSGQCLVPSCKNEKEAGEFLCEYHKKN